MSLPQESDEELLRGALSSMIDEYKGADGWEKRINEYHRLHDELKSGEKVVLSRNLVEDMISSVVGGLDELKDLTVAPTFILTRREIGEPLVKQGESLPDYMYDGRFEPDMSGSSVNEGQLLLRQLTYHLPQGEEATTDIHENHLPQPRQRLKVAWERYERDPEWDGESSPDTGTVEIELLPEEAREEENIKAAVSEEVGTIIDRIIILDNKTAQ